MIKAELDCIVCGTSGREVERNSLPMLICDSCGLFWRASFDLPENFYETREFDMEKTGKIEMRYTNSIERIETLRKYVGLDNLCDVGCGEGVFLKALTDFGYKNVIGLEPSKNVHDFAARNKLNIIRGEIEGLDKLFFGKNNIHTVAMFHVIEHLKDPQTAIKLICDDIEKGDKLIIETPDTDSYILKESGYKHELINPEHLHYFNKSNLSKLLEKSGFKVLVSGNRDFNEKNMSIRESLSRLGFIKTGEKTKNTMFNTDVDTVTAKMYAGGAHRRLIRGLLSWTVSLFGRGNYLWIVAEK